ncbi:MAG TPA: hypothetical protein VK668_20510 [Mucilaginibacter sp.]|nr:hypothetical protein [Mucilaginibacter sp.]
MKKIKYILLLMLIASLSSCGLFKKNCNCPHFSKVNTTPNPQIAVRA